MAEQFAHRTLGGWISEFVRRPLPGQWPQIPLDDETIFDLEKHFDLCRESGYNEAVVWGFFVDRRWPLDITSCLDADRLSRIERVIEAAHTRGLKIHSGLGLYSWGFDAIVEATPRLTRGNPHVMCPSVAESHAWMARVIDFVLGSFPFDGLNMQSADQGRCGCPECADLSDVEYHARLNMRVADYIHKRWPGKLLIMDNWGCSFEPPGESPHLVAMSDHLGYIVDHNNSAARRGRRCRRDLIQALHCPFGTLAGVSVWPPQRWRRDKWFLPTTLVNVDYIRQLHEDGARAVEQFVTALANPSGEVSLRFMGSLISDVRADAQTLLAGAVEATYMPRDAATRDGLVEIVCRAEEAYFSRSGRDLDSYTGLLYVDGGLMPKDDPSPETYLLDMSAADRASYAGAISRIADDFEGLRSGIGDAVKGQVTAQCFQSALADVSRIGSEP